MPRRKQIKGTPFFDADGFSELFPEKKISQKSPFLAWLDKHGIKLNRRTDLPDDCPKWEAYIGDYNEAIHHTVEECGDPELSTKLAIGETRTDAADQLAYNRGIESWNHKS